MIYGEYTTVNFVRKLYLSSNSNIDDTLILAFIRQATREISRISSRVFYPIYYIDEYDTPKGTDLDLRNELLSLTSITNGMLGTLLPADVVLYGPNADTHNMIHLSPVVSSWGLNSNNSPNKAISVEGMWGSLYDDTAGWINTSQLLDDLTDTITTIITGVGIFYAGQLLKINDEMMYISSISSVTVEEEDFDSLSVVRGINGTTATAHSENDIIYVWECGYDISTMTAQVAAAYYHMRSNPIGNTYTIDGISFHTPKDITKYIRDRLSQLSLLKVGFA
jgi:hypothetical protein